MTGARGLLPALPRGGSGGAACGPSRPSTRGHGVGGADDIGPRQAPLGGTTTKTIDSEVGPFEIEVPRDRAGSFTPRPVAPWARGGRGGLDSMIIGLYAGGMTAREIRHHSGVHHRRGS